ncbi:MULTISPECIES: hypothetical protein [Lachnospiraceae]|nr:MULTISPECIES: hypothetical protein [Lachnospiraceae]
MGVKIYLRRVIDWANVIDREERLDKDLLEEEFDYWEDRLDREYS